MAEFFRTTPFARATSGFVHLNMSLPHQPHPQQTITMTAPGGSANIVASLSAFRTFELMQADERHLASDVPGAVPTVTIPKRENQWFMKATHGGFLTPPQNNHDSKGFSACSSHADSPRATPTQNKGCSNFPSSIQQRFAVDHVSNTPHSLVYQQARRENLHRRMQSYPPAILPTPPTAHQLRYFMGQKESYNEVEYEHSGPYCYEDPILNNAPRMPRSDRLRQDALAKQHSTANIYQGQSSTSNFQSFLTSKAAGTRNPYPTNISYTTLEWPSDSNIIKQADAERMLSYPEQRYNTRSVHGGVSDPPIPNYTAAPYSRKTDSHPKYAENIKNRMLSRRGVVHPITTAANNNFPQADLVIVRTRNYFEECINGQRPSGSSRPCHKSDTSLRNEEKIAVIDREYRRQTTKDAKIDRFYIKRAECDFALQTTIKSVFKNGTPTAADIKSMMDAINYLKMSIKQNPASGVDDPWYERIAWIKNSVVGPHGRQVRTLRSIFKLLNGEVNGSTQTSYRLCGLNKAKRCKSSTRLTLRLKVGASH
ncbi:hypothetical protein DFP73DRAFT_585515 [Morchella snyderi]|nr:hypothetical protein DFP73DRAFT_585515 [Morchella snyderi]